MSTNATISLDQLTPEQIATLKSLVKTEAKAARPDRKTWNPIVDAMLQEREGDGFRWTTAQILERLQQEKVVKPSLATPERESEIKKIQTRKQLLERKRDRDGKLLFTVGYKPSANGVTITLDRVLLWVKAQSATDQDTLHRALGALITARTKPGSIKAESARK